MTWVDPRLQIEVSYFDETEGGHFRFPVFKRIVGYGVEIHQAERGKRMGYILRDIDIELWSKVKAKATLERKTMHEVIFQNLKWYATQSAPGPNKRKKGKKKEL